MCVCMCVNVCVCDWVSDCVSIYVCVYNVHTPFAGCHAHAQLQYNQQ